MIKAHEANDESSCINVHHFIETASNIGATNATDTGISSTILVGN